MTVEREELNEDELFDQAVDDNPADPPAADPQPEPEPEPQPEPDATLTADPKAEKPQVDDNAPLVPSWRLREINEEKRRAAEENERLKAELAQLRQTASRQQEQPKPADKPAKPDPLLDPDGYAKAVRDEIREEIIAERRESSLHAAHAKYTTEFEEAYAAAQKAVDPALRARMQSSRDPGETLIQWHREQKTRQEIGGDLNAYKQRLREEALKDPEFRKAAMAAWQAEANPQQPNGRPRVDLPPSLNGASRSNAALRSSQTDLSDDALWDEATA